MGMINYIRDWLRTSQALNPNSSAKWRIRRHVQVRGVYFDYDDEAQGSFPINCRRPNAHGGLHRPNNATLQPLSNRYQKYSARIRVSPLEILIAMRMLYQKAKLVHTDLSEFNILYFEVHLYIIDDYQAVEISHSDANEFLCQDCVHVSVTQAFFKKRGVAVMTVRELFDFKVDPSIAEEAVDSYLDEVHQKIADRGGYVRDR